MYKYFIDILRKNKNILKLLNRIKRMVNKKQLGWYYWFARLCNLCSSNTTMTCAEIEVKCW